MLKNRMLKYRQHLSSARLLAMGFFAVIAVGTALLMIPEASNTGSTGLVDALFTATSATCVTGLIPFDTATHWSLFGQIVIICLIQIGGLGFMSIFIMFTMLARKKINLLERRMIMDTAGSIRISGTVALVRKVAAVTFLIEGIGFILLSFRFCPQMGLGKGLFSAAFHSVSAFCNAGFDILGTANGNSSLSGYAGDTYVMVIIMALIVMGGIGFFVWSDIAKNKWHFRRYELHSKIVLTVTGALILGGAILFLITERSHSFAHLGLKDSIVAAFFQSVTTRTAGFAGVDMTKLSGSGKLLSIILMMIGGSPGSTAGGIKTTTFIVIIMNLFTSAGHLENVNLFRHRIDVHAVKSANAIATVYFMMVLIATFAICAMQPLPLDDILFEATSAIGTVGLTAGITPVLNAASKLIITSLMYFGRIGGMSIVIILAEKMMTMSPVTRPLGKIMVG